MEIREDLGAASAYLGFRESSLSLQSNFKKSEHFCLKRPNMSTFTGLCFETIVLFRCLSHCNWEHYRNRFLRIQILSFEKFFAFLKRYVEQNYNRWTIFRGGKHPKKNPEDFEHSELDISHWMTSKNCTRKVIRLFLPIKPCWLKILWSFSDENVTHDLFGKIYVKQALILPLVLEKMAFLVRCCKNCAEEKRNTKNLPYWINSGCVA